MMQVGPCDYETELQPLSEAASLTAKSSVPELMAEKQAQSSLLELFVKRADTDAESRQELVTRQAARAAAPVAALAAATAVSPALPGWQLSGDPARQQDREPPDSRAKPNC
jgi:hypothetical protein